MRTVGLILGTMLVSGACAFKEPPPALPAALDANALPQMARAALDEKWPNKGWQMASVDTQALSCPQAKGATGPILTADLDSDNLSDIAVEVATTHEGVRLAILMARDGGYALFDVGGVGDRAAESGLILEKKGIRYVKPDSKVADYYPSDTVTTVSCNQGMASYVWDGLGFFKQPVIDVTVAPGGAPPRSVAAPR